MLVPQIGQQLKMPSFRAWNTVPLCCTLKEAQRQLRTSWFRKLHALEVGLVVNYDAANNTEDAGNKLWKPWEVQLRVLP